jgi:hypothetical protein
MYLFGFLALSTSIFSQSNYSTDPLNAQFVTEDVDRFWEAFAKLDNSKENPFKEYIEKGTPGLKGFIKYRIESPKALLKMVKSRKDAYLARKDVLRNLEGTKKRVQAAYTAMKYWYADAVFPPVYIVVGRFNSGGTVSEDGIILGAEMMENLDGLPGLVAHELIHYQQKIENRGNLLTNAIVEGSADFIGELISGDHINQNAFHYGETNLEELCKEFVLLMDQDDNQDWLYGTSGKDGRPNDLGYWMGYKITAAYFEKQADKKQAIHDILHLKDAKTFLKESGFLAPYIAAVEQMTEEEKKKLIEGGLSEEKYAITFTVRVPEKEDEVYITGHQKELKQWTPNKLKLNKVSDYERSITLELHSPAVFKFTRGTWESEALIDGVKGMPNLSVKTAEDKTVEYTVSAWKDRKK